MRTGFDAAQLVTRVGPGGREPGLSQIGVAGTGAECHAAAGSLPWVPLALLIAMVGFVLGSYPMMRPGLDIWWHLGMIDAPAQADPVVFPALRIAWHHAWHQLFVWLAVDDVFVRALLIHRTQFLLTVLLLALSAYLVMRVMTRSLALPRASLWTAALLAAPVWLLMHGTYSAAHGGGEGAQRVLSWIQWYSVNYQISLPLNLAAAACGLYAAGAGVEGWRLVVAGLGGLVLAALGALAHAAETVYLLFFLGFLALIYLRQRLLRPKTLLLMGAVLSLVGLALAQSYVFPALLTRLLSGEFGGLLDETWRLGRELVDTGHNRWQTGWHAMHGVGVVALGVGTALAWWLARRSPAGALDWRPFVFVALTTLLPAALASAWGAGLFAQITHRNIMWRFAFASYLFVALPLLALVCSEWLARRAPAGARQLLSVAITVVACGLAIGVSHREPRQPAESFARSLWQSLDPAAMHFGVTPQRRSELSALAARWREQADAQPVCTDLFTAYQLFFVERYRAVRLPPALSYLPGYQTGPTPCDVRVADPPPPDVSRTSPHPMRDART